MDKKPLLSPGVKNTAILCAGVIVTAATWFFETQVPPPPPAIAYIVSVLGLAMSLIMLMFLGDARTALFGIFIFFGLSAPYVFTGLTTLDLLLFYGFVATAAALVIAAAGRHAFAVFGLIFCFALLIVLPENILAGYMAITKTRIGMEQMNVIMETNLREAMGYLQLHARQVTPLFIYVVAFCGLLFVAGFWLRGRRIRGNGLVTAMAVILLSTAATGTMAGQLRLHDVFLIPIENAHNASTLEVAQERSWNLASIGAHRTDPGKAIYIVVVGESANRQHLHLYGYFRQTTPTFDRLMKNGSLVAFRNAISSYCMTSFSLRRALTLATVDSNREYRDPGMYSVVEILRSAGFKTYWISNQPEEGQVPAIVLNNNEVFPFDPRNPDPLDDNVMGKVDHVLKQIDGDKAPTVLFVHIIGSHYPYNARYPAELPGKIGDTDNAAAFGPRVPVADINHYDNSILYTDEILRTLIEKLQREDVPSSLLYFSDHGESPYVGAGHDPGLFSIGHVEVPLILWFSPGYARKYPEILKAARQNIDGAFMLDRLTQVIMTWTHVEAPFYQPEHSLLTSQFMPVPRWTLDGRVNYDSLKDDYCAVTRKQTGFTPGHCQR